MRAHEFMTEKDSLKLPDINVGDEVKVGKFKNRKAEVKGFSKDDHNQPVMKTTKGDHKVLKARHSKLEEIEDIRYPKSYDNPKLGSKIERKLVGKIREYPVYLIKNDTTMRLLLGDKDSDEILGWLRLMQSTLKSGYITAVGFKRKIQGRGLGYDLYKFAIIKLNLMLVSDLQQSPGSKSVWKKLAQTKGILVYAFQFGNKNKQRADRVYVDHNGVLTTQDYPVYAPDNNVSLVAIQDKK